MFSKACEYAIRATIYIAVQSNQDNRVGLKDISKEIDSPEAFTAKILQQLSKMRLLTQSKVQMVVLILIKKKCQK